MRTFPRVILTILAGLAMAAAVYGWAWCVEKSCIAHGVSPGLAYLISLVGLWVGGGLFVYPTSRAVWEVLS